VRRLKIKVGVAQSRVTLVELIVEDVVTQCRYLSNSHQTTSVTDSFPAKWTAEKIRTTVTIIGYSCNSHLNCTIVSTSHCQKPSDMSLPDCTHQNNSHT